MSRAAPPLSSSYLLSDRVGRLPESLMSIGFRLLIVDDEPNIRSGLAKGLAKLVDQVETAGDIDEALQKFGEGDFAIVIADVRLPGDRSGLDLVTLLLERKPNTTVIVVTRARYRRNGRRRDASRSIRLHYQTG